jgi:FMN reductase
MNQKIAKRRPVVLGIGGTLRPNSSSEQALRVALAAASELGAEIEIIPAQALDLPNYDPERAETVVAANALVAATRRADALLIATPGYHGGMSGLIKNALDYLQALANGPAPYLHDKAVGCIVSAAGWQAGASTLTSLRTTIHALRGWPTPLGVAINSMTKPFGPQGDVIDLKVGEQLATLSEQAVTFARMRIGLEAS